MSQFSEACALALPVVYCVFYLWILVHSAAALRSLRFRSSNRTTGVHFIIWLLVAGTGRLITRWLALYMSSWNKKYQHVQLDWMNWMYDVFGIAFICAHMLVAVFWLELYFDLKSNDRFRGERSFASAQLRRLFIAGCALVFLVYTTLLLVLWQKHRKEAAGVADHETSAERSKRLAENNVRRTMVIWAIFFPVLCSICAFLFVMVGRKLKREMKRAATALALSSMSHHLSQVGILSVVFAFMFAARVIASIGFYWFYQTYYHPGTDKMSVFTDYLPLTVLIYFVLFEVIPISVVMSQVNFGMMGVTSSTTHSPGVGTGSSFLVGHSRDATRGLLGTYNES